MVKKLLGAAAVAAVACAFVPAHAAKVGVGCSGENLAKTEGTVETMADGPGKFAAQREIAMAQDSMLKDNMSGCAMHLGRAMQAETVAQTSYQAQYPGTATQAAYASAPPRARYRNSMAQAPYAEAPAQAAAPDIPPEARTQNQWGWQPIQGPR
jgi:hypothetical protein